MVAKTSYQKAVLFFSPKILCVLPFESFVALFLRCLHAAADLFSLHLACSNLHFWGHKTSEWLHKMDPCRFLQLVGGYDDYSRISRHQFRTVFWAGRALQLLCSRLYLGSKQQRSEPGTDVSERQDTRLTYIKFHCWVEFLQLCYPGRLRHGPKFFQ